MLPSEEVQCCIFIDNVHADITAVDVREFFSKFGTVKEIHLAATEERNCSKRGAFVRFARKAEVEYLMKLGASGMNLSRQLHVEVFSKIKRRKTKADSKCIDARTNTLINHLPNEMLAAIFNFMTPTQRIGIERVCKLWQGIASSVLWNISSLEDSSMPEGPFEEYIFRSLLKRCGAWLTNLTIELKDKFWAIKGRNGLDIVVQYCPNLETVWFKHQPRKVEMYDTDLVQYEVEESISSLEIFFTKCTKIKNITIENLKNDDSNLYRALQFCKNLEHLEIIIPRSFFREISLSDINPSVKSISFRGHVDDLIFTSLEHCHLIEELEFSDYIKICLLRKFVAQFSETLKKLIILQGSMCCYDHDDDFEIPLTDKILPNLTELVLNREYQLNDDWFSKQLKKIPNLKKIDISCTCLTGKVFPVLASYPDLIEVNISYLKGVKDEDILLFSKNAKLKEFTVNGIEALSDETCIRVIRSCKDLCFFTICECEQVTDSAIDAVIKDCRKTQLHIFAHCTAITKNVNTTDFCVYNNRYKSPINLK